MSEYLYTPIIKDGAIFIGDAHENVKRDGFLKFLHAIDSGKIPEPPQIFLLGDMFDFLSGESEYTINFYAEHLRLINKISEKIEIFYFEMDTRCKAIKMSKSMTFPHSQQILRRSMKSTSRSHMVIYFYLL